MFTKDKHFMMKTNKEIKISKIFSINDDNERARIINQLNKLRSSQGWKIVISHFEMLLKDLENDILNSEGSSAKVEFTEDDLKKQFRKAYREIIVFPDAAIDTLNDMGQMSEPDDDPYN